MSGVEIRRAEERYGLPTPLYRASWSTALIRGLVKEYCDNSGIIFLISPYKCMLWVLIKSEASRHF